MNNGKKKQSSVLTRRNLLKLSAAGLAAAAVTGMLGGLPTAQAATAALEGKKTLVVYYTRTGNTRALAQNIYKVTGGDIVELQTVTPYPTDYRATTEQAKKELETGFLPPLGTQVADIASYDVVFVGSPNWWGTLSMPVRSFLAQYDLSGKTLVPFITHDGSALGSSVDDLKKLCPGSTVLEGLAVRSRQVATSQTTVQRWLEQVGMAP